MLEPFGPVLGPGIFLTIWWVSLFIVLPIGVRSQEESGEVAKGTDPGAPVVTGMLKKLGYNTVLAVVIFVGVLLAARRWG